MVSKTRRRILGTLVLIAALIPGCAISNGSPDHGVGLTPNGGDRVDGPESQPPSEFRLGNAIAPINYYMTAWTVNNLFKMAGFEAEIGNTEPSQAWVPLLDGQWRIERRFDVPTDGLGWATSLELEGGGIAERLSTIVIGTDRESAFPSGTYRVLWEGSGTIVVEGPSQVTEVGPGEMTFEYDGSGEVIVSILETDPEGTGDYVRNIQVLRPDAVPGEHFNQTYLDDLRPYAIIRPLHFFGDQLTYCARRVLTYGRREAVARLCILGAFFPGELTSRARSRATSKARISASRNCRPRPRRTPLNGARCATGCAS